MLKLFSLPVAAYETPFDRVSVRRRGLFLFAEIYKCKSSGQRVQKSKVAPNIRARVTINIENKARPHSSATLSQSESANIDMVLSLVAMKAVNVRMCRFLNVPMFWEAKSVLTLFLVLFLLRGWSAPGAIFRRALRRYIHRLAPIFATQITATLRAIAGTWSVANAILGISGNDSAEKRNARQ
jgi:CBS domain containing-hemolysin-like protein